MGCGGKHSAGLVGNVHRAHRRALDAGGGSWHWVR